MVKKLSTVSGQARWLAMGDMLQQHVPHVAAWLAKEEDVREIRFKVRPDGTMLAIAKGYGSDGGMLVCFGAGYGFAGSLMALDSSLQGGNWRVDKPWSPNGNKRGTEA